MTLFFVTNFKYSLFKKLTDLNKFQNVFIVHRESKQNVCRRMSQYIMKHDVRIVFIQFNRENCSLSNRVLNFPSKCLRTEIARQ